MFNNSIDYGMFEIDTYMDPLLSLEKILNNYEDSI